MHARLLLAALGLAVLLAAPGEAHAPASFVIAKPRRLEVTHTTRVRVPEGTARLQVWQAKPLARTWPGLPATLGVDKATLAPTTGEEIETRSGSGRAWTWKVSEPAAGEHAFVSTFELLSADRDLKVAGAGIRWVDLPADTSELLQGLPALPVANELVREAAAKIKRRERSVVAALEAFAQWVNQHVAYVPGVPYGSQDLEAICKGRGGHCGHRATVYLALCQAAGLAARRVGGYALFNDAQGGLGVDDGNRHVWVEVHLPTLGWVEVEPAPRGSPFALSHLFVQCPRDLQSRFVVVVAKAGPESSPILSDTVRVQELK